MTYRELIDAGGIHFYTWGPNSGGWEGYICLDGHIWEARADRGVELGACRTYAEFLDHYSGDERAEREYAEVLTFLRGQGS